MRCEECEEMKCMRLQCYQIDQITICIHRVVFFADSYKEAFEIARPWIEQGYQVVFHLVSEGEILNE